MIGRTLIRSAKLAPQQGPREKGRHARRCTVCKHPDRPAIEEAFLNWRSAPEIVEEYGIAHHSALYRHAHATGLFNRRRGHIRTALEFIIERASRVKPTGNVIINAVRAYAHLTDDGRWIEPEKKYIIEHIGQVESPAPPDPVSTKRPSSHSETVPRSARRRKGGVLTPPHSRLPEEGLQPLKSRAICRASNPNSESAIRT